MLCAQLYDFYDISLTNSYYCYTETVVILIVQSVTKFISILKCLIVIKGYKQNKIKIVKQHFNDL